MAAFQSTPSGRKATNRASTDLHPDGVSIHAFREEGDELDPSRAGPTMVSIHAFREEGDTTGVPASSAWSDVSIHAFREEGDALRAAQGAPGVRFQSTPSGRKATTCEGWSVEPGSRFNPRLPGGRRPPARR